ncbi:MAG: helix-hairpin-helix domain-containing protein [Desulfomonile tiedjei]|nr:helix-hairpin-helix domain-containing protein [Desulfomonile tiedjei]
MTVPGTSRSREFPVRGLIMIGVGVVLAGIASSLAQVWLWSGVTKGPGRGDCVYQVIRDGECLGAVFLDDPATAQDIGRRIGLADQIGGSDPGNMIPCGSRLHLQAASGTLIVGRIPGGGLVAAGKPIDLNSAKESDLVAVPGIGPVLAKRIVETRDRQGGFSRVENLGAIQGIHKKKLATFRPWIMVAPREPRGHSDR